MPIRTRFGSLDSNYEPFIPLETIQVGKARDLRLQTLASVGGWRSPLGMQQSDDHRKLPEKLALLEA